MDIIPALIPNNLAELTVGAERISEYAPKLHLDVNDGVFDPAVSWPCGAGQWEELEHMTTLPGCEALEVMVHLMVSDPERIGVLFARAGAYSLSVHLESFHESEDARAVFQVWKEAGIKKIGLVLLMDTPLTKLLPLKDDIDFVQLMSIAHVGFQKQPFEERILPRIKEVHQLVPQLPIAVDGGVSKHNIQALAQEGATIGIVGSAIVGAPNPQHEYEEFLRVVKSRV